MLQALLQAQQQPACSQLMCFSAAATTRKRLISLLTEGQSLHLRGGFADSCCCGLESVFFCFPVKLEGKDAIGSAVQHVFICSSRRRLQEGYRLHRRLNKSQNCYHGDCRSTKSPFVKTVAIKRKFIEFLRSFSKPPQVDRQ